MGESDEKGEAIAAQVRHSLASRGVDRTGWTRNQWIDDAERLMDSLDGAVTALVNGHVLALLAEVRDLRRSAAAASPPVSRGAALVVKERARQVTDEGYTAEHDAGHEDELARAAATYAMPEAVRELFYSRFAFRLWPWHERYWSPTPDDRVRELVKAGALIVAAIDSLLDSEDPS